MNPWSGPSGLDRLDQARSEEDLERLWAGALVLEVDADGHVAARGGTPVPLQDPGARRPTDVLLGVHDGLPWFARLVSRVTDQEPTSWRDIHPDHWQLAAAAVAVMRWHATSPRCEACGEATVPDYGGARRRCPACGQLAFARQDPAIIVAVLDPEERLLLGRQAVWPPRRFSVLAGFLEPGESVEQAVWREVAEEVGVRLEAVSYVSSQPWPMPRSLMLGFVAAAPDARVEVDGEEIVEAGYWRPQQLRDAVSSGDLSLPGGASIARYLIEEWLAGRLRRPAVPNG